MNYKESSVAGTQWQRCCSIHIQNTYGQTPQITLQEERLTDVNGQMFQQGAGGLNITFDPAAEIPLLNPADGTPLGATMTQGQIHVALWSLYMQAANARDAAIAAEIAQAAANAQAAIDLAALQAAEQAAAETLAAAQASADAAHAALAAAVG